MIWQELLLRHHWSYSGKQGVDQEQGFQTLTHNTRECLHNTHTTTVHGVCWIHLEKNYSPDFFFFKMAHDKVFGKHCKVIINNTSLAHMDVKAR